MSLFDTIAVEDAVQCYRIMRALDKEPVDERHAFIAGWYARARLDQPDPTTRIEGGKPDNDLGGE